MDNSFQESYCKQEQRNRRVEGGERNQNELSRMRVQDNHGNLDSSSRENGSLYFRDCQENNVTHLFMDLYFPESAPLSGKTSSYLRQVEIAVFKAYFLSSVKVENNCYHICCIYLKSIIITLYIFLFRSLDHLGHSSNKLLLNLTL